MCGRFSLFSESRILRDQFLINQWDGKLEKRYNIAPSQKVFVVFDEGGLRAADMFTWGFIPHWMSDKSQRGMINARCETIDEKPYFKESFIGRRCIIPADGFFEWRRTSYGREPYFFRSVSGAVLGFAGVYDVWKRSSNVAKTCAIVTCAANKDVSEVHDRMPVILEPSQYSLWLDPLTHDKGRLRNLLDPAPTGFLESYPIDRKVGDVDSQGPSLIKRVEAESKRTPQKTIDDFL